MRLRHVEAGEFGCCSLDGIAVPMKRRAQEYKPIFAVEIGRARDAARPGEA